MASSSSSPPELAFSSRSRKYHVFLSFRGEDTRKTFVDHLYTGLVQRGIYTYKDDETLPRGVSIGPSLMKAIEESQIAVIVFSTNYADSSWCLDELAYIMKCKDKRGQIVMPIFYDVEPSAVRKQKQKYGEAFSKHELENGKKVETWRKALVDASNLSGWEPKHMANGHESKVIKEIVDTISHRLHPMISSANEKLIGIEARMQDLKSKLELDLGGVRMIGIWGVGGGGKTTLASSVYSEISSKFDFCCFVENIREESRIYGMKKLEEKILFSVLPQNVIDGSKDVRQLLMDRLPHINLLLVLDDVDHLDHLKTLAGSHDWFGEGSRIIITTRDEHLLTVRRVDAIYNIRLLNNVDSTKLFRKHAPQDSRPMEDYELLSKHVVSYAGGLPLALTVLGCFLCDKDINEWRSALARLKAIPETDIVEKLKISYDGLKAVEKELFLDIACFFRGKYKDGRAMATFDACGFYPDISIKVLIQKALITVSDGKFDMHDLVQEMGHYIVRGEYPKNPEKHSRVWKKEDVLKVCAMDATKELDMVEAIRFESNRYAPVELLPPFVANMKNLRWIDWRVDLASPFPTKFPPGELCCLILDGISQKQLWKGYKHLPNLKILELARLKNLLMTPDFDGLPNLERFILHGCLSLEKIHPSIGYLENLVFVSIEECSRLKMFPPITQLKKLETLSFSMCRTLNMDNSPHLNLDNSGKEVASYRKSLANFFVTWWTSGNHNTGLRFFHNGLRKLDLSYCNVGDKDIVSAVWELPSLEELNLAGNNITRLNFSPSRLPRLKWLGVTNCNGLIELSELPPSIAVVVANDCPSLANFGDVSKCKWLWKVSLLGKKKLGPHGGDILLHSILQRKAIADHFISYTLEHQMIPKGFVGRLFRAETFTLHLPHNWYNDFYGFLICFVTKRRSPRINIIIKQKEVDEDSRSELWQECNEAPDAEYDGRVSFVGYVSFSSLRHNTTLLNSSYNMISFSIENGRRSYAGETYAGETYVGAKLIPRKSKGDEVQATYSSEFWDKEHEDGSTFTIKHDSKYSIKILWQPYYYNQVSKKRKLVVKLEVYNIKEKENAMKMVYSISGVGYLAMDMKDKKLTVIGDFDPVSVVFKLKKCCYTEIVWVGPAECW